MNSLTSGLHDSETCASWSFERFPYAIQFEKSVLQRIRIETVDGLVRLSHGGLEVGGVLFGQVEPGRIHVTECIRLNCEHALGPSFTLSERDLQTLSAVVDEGKAKGLVPIGWYHSHTRSGIGLTEKDLEIHERYFS